MDTRIKEFDYIRCIALIGILLCHSCLEISEESVPLGRFLGVTFNFLFLILSAFLFGIGWDEKRRPRYGLSFLGRRMIKLSRTYYPYLAILFAFLYVTEDFFSWSKVISHLLYLPWFDKIDGFGHLWFMTMIVICYLGCWAMTHASDKLSRCNMLIINIIIISGGVIMDYMITNMGWPGYIFPYLTGYLLIFYYSRAIISFIRRLPPWLNTVQFMALNTAGIMLFRNHLFESDPFLAYLVGMVCALSVFSFMMLICRSLPSSKVVLWLSGISFEIYLVHEFFLGKYSVYDMTDNVAIGFILLVICSISAAIALKFISSFCRQRGRSKTTS